MTFINIRNHKKTHFPLNFSSGFCFSSHPRLEAPSGTIWGCPRGVPDPCDSFGERNFGKAALDGIWDFLRTFWGQIGKRNSRKFPKVELGTEFQRWGQNSRGGERIPEVGTRPLPCPGSNWIGKGGINKLRDLGPGKSPKSLGLEQFQANSRCRRIVTCPCPCLSFPARALKSLQRERSNK